jgi:cephalosporin hydroxylase
MGHYERLLEDANVERLLEIGVAQGHSLRTWHEVMPEALIVGVDILEPCRLQQRERIAVIIANAANPASMVAVNTLHGPFDVVVDDGEHVLLQVRLAFESFYPYMPTGGLYFVEDLNPDDPDVQAWAASVGGEIIRCIEGCLIVVRR